MNQSSPALPRISRRSALQRLGLVAGAAFALTHDSSARPEVLPDAAGTGGGAPSLAGLQAGYYRFNIGALEAIALQDGGFASPADKSPFAVGEPAGAVAAGLEAAMLSPARVQVPFNNLLVKVGSELVLVDAGCGPLYGAGAGLLPAGLRNAGVTPAQITAVILSHAHGDHFGGLLDPVTKAPAFPNAQVFVSRTEHAFWMQAAPDLSGMAAGAGTKKAFAAGAQGVLTALKDRLNLVAGGDKILGGIELLDTSGHTPGHLAVVFGSGSDELLHFADAAHHNALSFANPGWRFAYDTDAAAAAATRLKLFDRAAADRVRLFGSHMPFPALGRVRRAGGAYEFVAEPFLFG